MLMGIPAHGGDSVAEIQARLDTLFGGHAPYQDFLGRLQKAVAADDRDAEAALASYPLKTRMAGRWVTVHDAGQFVARYRATPATEKP